MSLLALRGPDRPDSDGNGTVLARRRPAYLPGPLSAEDLCDELWLRYFELGGMSTPDELERCLRWGVALSGHERDVLLQALNERVHEVGTPHGAQLAVAPPSENAPSPPLLYGEGRLCLLGSFSVCIGAETVRLPMDAQRLISFLALHDGLLLRQHVAGSLWGDVSERCAAGSLRTALWRLRQHSHSLVAVSDSSHLTLFPSVAVDIRSSEELARRILDDSQDLSEGDLDDALLSADLLPDWTEDWVLVFRGYHTQLRLRALEALCRRLGEMKRFGQAVQAGIRAVSLEPLRESAQRTLVVAHLAEGNVAAAVKQYDSFRELLRDELGLEPSPELYALVRGLKRPPVAAQSRPMWRAHGQQG